MTTATATIFDELKSLGPAFYGSNDTQAREIAAEWADYFSDPQDAINWMHEGFWCPETAYRVSELGIEPGDIKARCNDYITGFDSIDAIYAMCNGDMDVDGLTD